MKLKRYTTTVLVAAMLTSTLMFSPHSLAQSSKQIDKQIEEAKREIKEREEKAAQAKAEAAKVQQDKQENLTEQERNEAELAQIIKELEALADQIQQTKLDVDEAKAMLEQIKQELAEATAKVEKQDELLQARARLMYTNGTVSYIDVLFGATSFTDFLDRLDSLQIILESDREILESFREAKALEEQKKLEQEESVAHLNDVLARQEAEKQELAAKEEEKEKLRVKLNLEFDELNHKHSELSEITEEQEKAVMALASKVAKLLEEKKRIENPYTGGKLGLPIDSKYRVNSNFGMRVHPITGKKKAHNGVDIAAPSGTPIYAAEAGTVIVADYVSGYGNTVIINHGGGIWTLYAHIKNGGILVSEGDEVKRGDKIALVGSTGNSTGPHLHFEVRKDEVPVNPMNYLK